MAADLTTPEGQAAYAREVLAARLDAARGAALDAIGDSFAGLVKIIADEACLAYRRKVLASLVAWRNSLDPTRTDAIKAFDELLDALNSGGPERATAQAASRQKGAAA